MIMCLFALPVYQYTTHDPSAVQVKDLGRVYGPSGKYIAEMERLSDTVITLPPMSARLPGVTVTIELASADAACNAQARGMIKAALKGLPWLDIRR